VWSIAASVRGTPATGASGYGVRMLVELATRLAGDAAA
jgi:hypothetical protein